jgi:hypothetical protein
MKGIRFEENVPRREWATKGMIYEWNDLQREWTMNGMERATNVHS